MYLLEPLDDDNEPTTLLDSFDDVLEIKLLDAALKELRLEEREVIFLNIVEEFSAQEIAKLTNQNRNTVLSLLHWGKRKLLRYFQSNQQRQPYEHTNGAVVE